METKYNDIRNSLETYQEIKKSTYATGIILCSLLVISGIISMIIGIFMGAKAISIATSLMCLGALLVAAGLWVFFKKGSQWIYHPTGSRFRTGQLIVGHDHMKQVTQAIAEGDFSRLSQLKENAMGGVKLEYAVTRDGSFGMVQMATYQGCSFVPVSDVIILSKNQAESLAQLSTR